MAVHLPWNDLKHRRARTAAALAGVVVAIVLLYMQLGFYDACRISSMRILDLMDFELAITSSRYSYILESHHFAQDLLQRADAVEGVAGVSPVGIAPATWRNPETGRSYDTLAVGLEPQKARLRSAEANAQLGVLHKLDTVLFDRASHPILGENPPGTISEMARRRLTVAGEFSWGAGFTAQGIVLTSRQTFDRLFAAGRGRQLQVGLIHLETTADPEWVRAELQKRLPEGVTVWTRSQIKAQDRRFFMRERPIGLMFTSGVVVALWVGAMILFQILASEVTSRRSELATLQALGFSRRKVHWLITEQGLLYALLAYVPATLITLVLFKGVRDLTRLPVDLGFGLAGLVLVLSLIMCCLGAVPAGRRVCSADPAELF